MQKHAVHMCRVATVVMETTQVVLSQFKNFIAINGELNKVSVPKIVSECCELVKLCYVILIVAVRFFYNILKQFEELIREKDSVYNDTLLFQHVCALFLDFCVIFSVR